VTILRRRVLAGVGGAVFLAGAAAAAGIEEGALPGRSILYQSLGLDGEAGVIPTVATGAFVQGSFVSSARQGRTVGWAASYPPGYAPGESLPVVVALHGYGGDHSDAFGTRLGLDRFQARAVAQGQAPFVVAAIDGGNSYWHHRASGEDSAAMVTDEFLPLLKARGLDTSRLALAGWSMGAYGALLLASDLGQGRVAAASGLSVALWPTVSRAATGAFDGPADFWEHDLYRRQAMLADIPLRIDCGTGDGFRENDRALVTSLSPHPAGGFEPGGHDMAFWRRLAPDHLTFLAAHLG